MKSKKNKLGKLKKWQKKFLNPKTPLMVDGKYWEIEDYCRSGNARLTDFGIIEYYMEHKQIDMLRHYLEEYETAADKICCNCRLLKKIEMIKSEIKRLKKRTEAQEQYDDEMYEYEMIACYGV